MLLPLTKTLVLEKPGIDPGTSRSKAGALPFELIPQSISDFGNLWVKLLWLSDCVDLEIYMIHFMVSSRSSSVVMG